MAIDNDQHDPFARDVERIQALRDQGRLTEDEASRLIAVLRGEATSPEDEPAGASDAATEPAAGAAQVAEPAAVPEPAAPASPRAPDPPLAPEPPVAPEAPAAPQPVVAESASGVRWLTTEMLAADLVVVAVEGLGEPRLRAQVQGAVLQPEGSGWRLRYRVDGGSWPLWGNRPERIEVEIPRGAGVQLDVKAGDVKLEGVEHVRGHMFAGDLNIDGATSVDVDMKTGDLDARIRPTAGRQRLVCKAGDLKVTLLRGADVRLTASVKLGELSVKGALLGRHDTQGLGHRYSGTLGDGRAELELRLAAGDLRVRTEA